MILFLLLSFKSIFNSTREEVMQLAQISTVYIFIHQIPGSTNFEKTLIDNWNSFTKINEERTSDYIIDINFDQDREFCQSFNIHQTDIPAFIILNKQSPTVSTKNELINFFHKPEYQLSNANFFSGLIVNPEPTRKTFDLSCVPFDSSTAVYPAFVFSSSTERGCSLVTRFRQLYTDIADHFYYRVDKDRDDILFYYNQTEFVKHAIHSSRKSIIREYRFFSFDSSWSANNIRQFRRNVVFVVYSDRTPHPLYDDVIDHSSPESVNNQETRKMINDILGMFWRTFVFNKMTYKQFRNYFSAGVYEVPFLVISDSTKSRFMVVKNISVSLKETIISTLKSVERGDLDDDMPFTFEPLLPKSDRPNRKPKHQLAFTTVAFLMIMLTAFLIQREAAECINLKAHRHKKALRSKSNYIL